MSYGNQRACDGLHRATDTRISRRAAIGSSSLTLLGALTGSALGQEPVDQKALEESRRRSLEGARELGRQADEAAIKRMKERIGPEQSALYEQMFNAGSVEERARIAQDWQLQHMLEKLKRELGASEDEWSVIQPRIVAVFRMMHTQASFAKGEIDALALVAQRTSELQELLRNKDAKPEEIKAKLTALRAAKERVRQELIKAQRSLRRLMTLRQEAVLVVNGLLD